MKPIRIRKHVDSEYLPELRAVMGEEVDITITPAGAAGSEPLETLETFLGDALDRPAPTPEEWAQIREAAKDDPAWVAALAIAEAGGPDVEAIVAIRASSPA